LARGFAPRPAPAGKPNGHWEGERRNGAPRPARFISFFGHIKKPLAKILRI